MARKKLETFYVIDEEGDILEVHEAYSAKEAIRNLYTELPQETDPFFVTVFNAKDAERFRIEIELLTETHIIEVNEK